MPDMRLQAVLWAKPVFAIARPRKEDAIVQ